MINVQYESLDFRKSSFGQLHFFLIPGFAPSQVLHTPGISINFFWNLLIGIPNFKINNFLMDILRT